jgi:hypothetical protein
VTLYTFHLYGIDGAPLSLEAADLDGDGDTFGRAGRLLEEHLSCDHVEVWDGERAVLARHRFQPVIRPVGVAAAS